AEQADRARAQPVGRDRQGPRRRGAARAQRQLAHPGRARGEPDVDAGRAERVAELGALSALPPPLPHGSPTARLAEVVRSTYGYAPAALAGYMAGVGVVAMLFWGAAPMA